jgi:hypothetical protein
VDCYFEPTIDKGPVTEFRRFALHRDTVSFGFIRFHPTNGNAMVAHLNDRYSGPSTQPPPDHPDRVVIVVRPTAYSKQ